jgi:hypothetical protein
MFPRSNPTSPGGAMPSSAIRTFTDPEMYFRGIRNLQIDGVITKRGEFRAESTHIDLHRLRMYRSDESVPRIMKVAPSGMRAGIVFATDFGEPSMLINGVEIADDQISRNGLDWEWYLRSSAPCRWGSMSLMPEDLAAASKAIIGIGAGEFRPQPDASNRCSIAIAEAARSGGPAREDRPGHPR